MTKIFVGAGLAGLVGGVLSAVMRAVVPQSQSAAVWVDLVSTVVLLVSLVYCAVISAIPKWENKGAWRILYPIPLKFAGFFFFATIADWILKVPSSTDRFDERIFISAIFALTISINFRDIWGRMKSKKSVQKQP